MLRIEHLEQTPGDDLRDDPRAPGKRYADALWRAHPRLSPDWWHEALGHTVGKLALDWRNSLVMPQALAEGCNLVVVSPASWPKVVAHIGQQPEPEAYISVMVAPAPWDVARPDTVPNATVKIWHPPFGLDKTARQQGLVALECDVREGGTEAYGVVVEGEVPLHQWLEEAALAAATVWGRKKRPALRWVVVEQDLLHLDHFTHPSTHHRDEAVSTVELASRLGLAVVVLPPVLPGHSAPIPAALAALTHAAECEARLHQTLGGWPQAAGQPLFSLLASLGRGQVPWPTPQVWQAWRRYVWPELEATWQTLQTPANYTDVAAYLQALGALGGMGHNLAVAAAQPLLEQALSDIRPRLPHVWQEQAPVLQALAVLVALPAVTAVAIEQEVPLQLLRETPSLPDVAVVLGRSR